MKYLFLFFMLLAVSCSTSKPKKETVYVPEPSVVPVGDFQSILSDAMKSSCVSYSWKNRGVAPKGYIKGMMLSFAQEVCGSDYDFDLTGSEKTDALSYYKIESSMVNTYAFLIGLGMRESSGKYCTGRDTTASNTSAISAETGLFQTSYDAGTATEILKKYGRSCHLEVFKEGVSCSDANLKNFGSGVGFDFQKKSKDCPTFAAKVGAETIRKKRSHYGPINRKEVEFRSECSKLLLDVKMAIEKNKPICEKL